MHDRDQLIPHPRFERLWITANGRVFHQMMKNGILHPIRESTQSKAGNGYMQIIVTREGKRQTLAVHRLVCETFHADTWFEGALACHNDSNPLNNTPENLRWDTPKANMHDKSVAGNDPNGAKTHCPRGHEYNNVNTYEHGGRRFCRPCHRISCAKRKARRGEGGILAMGIKLKKVPRG